MLPQGKVVDEMSFAADLQPLVSQIVRIWDTGGFVFDGTITELDAENDRLVLSVNGLPQQVQISNVTSVRKLS